MTFYVFSSNLFTNNIEIVCLKDCELYKLERGATIPRAYPPGPTRVELTHHNHFCGPSLLDFAEQLTRKLPDDVTVLFGCNDIKANYDEVEQDYVYRCAYSLIFGSDFVLNTKEHPSLYEGIISLPIEFSEEDYNDEIADCVAPVTINFNSAAASKITYSQVLSNNITWIP